MPSAIHTQTPPFAAFQQQSANPPRQPPPASPDDCGLQPLDVEEGPNDFRIGLEGPELNLATGGTHDQQEAQRDTTVALAVLALESYVTHHAPGVDRLPPDAEVQQILDSLTPNPPIGTDGENVTHIVYQSSIPNADAQQAYTHFVENPEQVFEAGGMEIRPPTERLEDGGRYMLEIGAPVPTWLPIEVHLDPENNAITILTLDGHVLRGEQTFTFTDDGNGGTTLTQDARFQTSSVLPGELQELTSISSGQHAAWQYAHMEIYEEFNGDPDFEGMGIDVFNSGQIETWSRTLMTVVRDPGNAVDVAIDSTGEAGNMVIDASGRLADWGIDMSGEAIRSAFDLLGIPGGNLIAEGFDTLGNWLESGADWAGDQISDGADAVGDVVENVIDWVTPWND